MKPTGITGMLVCAAACCALSVNARVVYDAGEALLENFAQNGAAAVNPYTAANGGQWWYGSSTAFSNGTFTAYTPYTRASGFRAFGTGGTLPYVAVNSVKEGAVDGGVTFNYGQLLLHPGLSGSYFTLVRFTVPEDGWYSAQVELELIAKSGSDGVDYYWVVDGRNQLAGGLSCYKGNTWFPTAGYRSPVRFFAAGTKLEFVLGRGAGSSNNADGTKAKISVCKEDAGTFFDLSNDFIQGVVNGTDTNFFQGASGAIWRFGGSMTTANTLETATLNDNVNARLLTNLFTRASGLTGLSSPLTNSSYAPYVTINTNKYRVDSVDPALSSGATLAPAEMLCNVNDNGQPFKNMVIRFQPPATGYYSGRIFLRDVACQNPTNTTWDGVFASVYANRTCITNLTFGYEEGCQYAFLEVPSRLITAGEWIDLILTCNANYYGDGTAVAMTFFKDADAPPIYDAGAALKEVLGGGTAVNPFTDSAGQTWLYGYRYAAEGDAGFTAYTALQTNLYNNSGLYAWALNNALPRIFVNLADGLGKYVDGAGAAFPFMAPGEIFSHPNTQSPKGCPGFRWTAPTDGVYRVHGMVRDVSAAPSADASDGVCRYIVTAGGIVDKKFASIDSFKSSNSWGRDYNMRGYEVSDVPYVYLRSGEYVDNVLVPNSIINNDSTFMSFTLVKEDNAFDSDILNIRFAAACTDVPRLGWQTLTNWNCTAGGEVQGLRLADGRTRTNVGVALGEGVSLATGLPSSGKPMQTAGLLAATSAVTNSFTISSLRPNEQYALAVYSLTTNWITTTLAFDAAGVTAPSDTLTAYAICDDVRVFKNVAADAAGRIVCRFTSTSANSPAVVNAVQVFGDFPEYVSPGTMIFVK